MKQNPCRYCAISIEYKGTHRPSLTDVKCDGCKNLNEHLKYLEKQRKFDKGELITSLDELLNQEWVMWYGRTKHIEVFKHSQLKSVLRWLEVGAFHKAVRKEDAT